MRKEIKKLANRKKQKNTTQKIKKTERKTEFETKDV